MEESNPDTPLLVTLPLDHPRLVAGLVLVVTLASAVGLARLDFSDSPRDIYSREDAHSKRLDQVHQTFGADDTDIVIVLDGEDLLTRRSLTRIHAFVEELGDQEHLRTIHSIFDARRAVKLGRRTTYLMMMPAEERDQAHFDRAREHLLVHPLLKDRLLAADGKTMVVVVQMPDTAVEIVDIVAIVDQVRACAERHFIDSAIRARLTGQPVLRVETFYDLKDDQVKFSVVCGVTLFCIALLLFRRLQPVFVSLLGPGLGVLWTVGAMGWLGQRFDGINVVLPMLLFVIGFTDSLHLVVAIRKLRRAGKTPQEAARQAVGQLGRACLLTSVTTAVGFGSLSLSSLSSVHRFGVYAALGTIALFCAVLVVVPLLTTWPWFREIAGHHHPPTNKPQAFFTGVGRLLFHYSGTTSLLGILAVAWLAVVARSVEFDMHWSEALPISGETTAALQHLDDQLGGSVLAYIVVEWPEGVRLRSPAVMGCLTDIHDMLDALTVPTSDRPTRLGQPTSLLTILQGLQGPGDTLTSRIPYLQKNASQRLRRMVHQESRQFLVSIPLPDKGARTLLPIFQKIDAEIDRLITQHPGFSAHLTGTTVLSARNLHEILHELVQSLIVAAVIVFAVLCVAFRSLRLGLISVIPNSFPLLVVVACLVLVGTPMQVTAALTLCLSLGVAVDDTIHLVSRFNREQSQHQDIRSACLGAYQAVGHVIVMTTVILICGFATMLLSYSPAIRLFGGLACVSLVAALVGDLFFLPALLARLAPRQSE